MAFETDYRERPIEQPGSHQYIGMTELAAALGGGVAGQIATAKIVTLSDSHLHNLDQQLSSTEATLTYLKSGGSQAFLKKQSAHEQRLAYTLQSRIDTRKQIDSDVSLITEGGALIGAALLAVAVGAFRYHLWKGRVHKHNRQQLITEYGSFLDGLETTNVNNN